MKATTLTFMLCAIVGASARAQDTAAATAPTASARIGVIDLERVAAESAVGKDYAGKLEVLQKSLQADAQKKQADLQKMDDRIKGLQDQLVKDQATLSDETAQQRQDEIVRLTREREAFRQDGERDLERAKERSQRQADALSAELRAKLDPFVKAVVQEKGIALLVDQRVCLSASKDFDITPDVIRKVNEGQPAGAAKPTGATGATGAAKPPAAPAAKPAAPKPATPKR